MILSVVAVASAGIVQLGGHGYAGEEHGHETIAYAPVAAVAPAHIGQYGGHEDEHVDYHVRNNSHIISIQHLSS